MEQVKMTTEFDRYGEGIVGKYQIPGLALGLSQEGTVVAEKGFGYRDTEKGLPLSSDTVFGIGSITKSFTCAAILQLQERGKLSVHDPVVKHLPEFKTPVDSYTQEITIHHFMTHTSGLPPLPTLFGALRRSMERDAEAEGTTAPAIPLPYLDTHEQYLDSLAAQNYDFLGAPGEEFSYSNDGYSLLGIIVERTSGLSYEQYIKENILEPIGMKNSVFHLEELDRHEDVASLYNSRPEGDRTIVYESNLPWDAPPMRAAGFLKSTVNDMLKYADVFLHRGVAGSRRILSPESVELMTTPHVRCDYDRYYGYGFMIVPDFYGYKLVEHGGSIKGVSAQMAMLPELGLAGVAFANLNGVPSETVLRKALTVGLGKPLDASHSIIPVADLSEERLKEYEGMFPSGEGALYRFYVEDGSLRLEAAGFPRSALTPHEEDWFSVRLNDIDFRVRFIRDADNRIFKVAFGFRQIVKAKDGV